MFQYKEKKNKKAVILFCTFLYKVHMESTGNNQETWQAEGNRETGILSQYSISFDP